jgi:hypothetical protein
MDVAVTGESLESLNVTLIGVNMNNPTVISELDKLQKACNITQFVSIADATSTSIAKIAGFISKSVISQSQALGSGGPSQTLSF